MQVISHLPTTTDGRKVLSDRLTTVYSEAVVTYISRLSCPNEQKQGLLTAVAQTVKSRGAE